MAVLPFTVSSGYCGGDIEQLKAGESAGDGNFSIGEIREIIGNLIKGRGIPRAPVPESIPEPNGFTAYDRVKALFAAGTLPEEKDVTGWYAGRTFSEKQPNAAGGTLLVGSVMSDVAVAGPLFPGALRIRIFEDEEKSGYYDEMSQDTIEDYKRHADERLRTSTADTVRGTNEIITSWSIIYDGKAGEIVCKIRKNGEYLVVKIERTVFVAGKNITDAHYAYFFKNVTPSVR